MMTSVDDLLNRLTMYRLVLYYLAALLVIALCFSALNLLPYSPLALIFSVALLTAVAWGANAILARTFEAPANVESAFISALILALIITPQASVDGALFLFWAAVWAMASKYLIAINRKHVFNPIAFAVALTALTVNQTASWWVASPPLLPFVLVGGWLVVRKVQREAMALTFAGAAFVATLGLTVLMGGDPAVAAQNLVLYAPLVFFASAILTEPLTTPPTRTLQIVYGAIVGVLFIPQVHFGPVYLTPELAVLLGNVFSFAVSPKARLVLTLKRKVQIAPDAYDFIFAPDRKLAFAPGQYMEWTLAHARPDDRGNRRYFTLASAPSENELRVGVRFNQPASSFKRALLEMDKHTPIVASQLAGDFTLPGDPAQKCVFIAGGIGITPFRSMLKYLLDTNQRRAITVFYVNRAPGDIVYRDVLDEAERRLGIRTVYSLTDSKQAPPGWRGRTGRLDGPTIRQEVPDFRTRMFFISGPNAMVTAFRETLLAMGVRHDHIKTDFFPGFA